MNIGLLGYGVVGKGVASIIDELVNDRVKVQKILMHKDIELTDERMTHSYQEILDDESIDVVVECIGGLEPSHTYIAQALKAHKNVVTSNKKMFATYMNELLQLAEENGVSIRYEACVGGGIPWIENIQQIRRIVPITKVYGIVNGTTNYILSLMHEKDCDFDEVLAQAQKAGYAERNPTDDIDGYDARYKIAITAMSAFGKTAEIEQIPCFGICNINAKDIQWAKQNGLKIKLLASAEMNADALGATVMPVAMSEHTYLANVNSNLNVVVSESKTLGQAAFVGQGAGSLPTAHAVVQDVLSIHQKQFNVCEYVNNDISSMKGDFYIRGLETPFDMEYETISDDAVLVRNASLEAVLNAVKDKNVFLMRVDYD